MGQTLRLGQSPDTIEELQPRDGYVLYGADDRGKKLVGNDFFWVLGQAGFEALSPCHAQLCIDVNDVDAGSDGFAKVLVVSA